VKEASVCTVHHEASQHDPAALSSSKRLPAVTADGASAETSVVGNEGLIGLALFMGGETTPSRAIVQSAGSAYRLVGQRLSPA